jgi:hypothetical protein
MNTSCHNCIRVNIRQQLTSFARSESSCFSSDIEIDTLYRTLEFSRRELVPSDFPLVALHIELINYFYLWNMLGGSVGIQLKSNLFWFIEGPTPFSTSRHAKISLILDEPI